MTNLAVLGCGDCQIPIGKVDVIPSQPQTFGHPKASLSQNRDIRPHGQIDGPNRLDQHSLVFKSHESTLHFAFRKASVSMLVRTASPRLAVAGATCSARLFSK